VHSNDLVVNLVAQHDNNNRWLWRHLPPSFPV
jgi:hypothetical protein